MEDDIHTPTSTPFCDLTEAEKKLLVSVRTGEVADFSSPTEKENVPENIGGATRTIRAQLLRWLCLNQDATSSIDAKGIRIKGAKISGVLDFDSARIPFPLALLGCAIPEGIDLRDAETRRLDLRASHTGRIDADGLVVRGGVFLGENFQASRGISLLGATISGDLDCSGGQFVTDKDGTAVYADNVEVGGSAYFDRGFSASGEVRLYGATIGGNLYCDGGNFLNKGRIAFYASKATIGVNAFFRQATALGEVRLHGTTITGNLECQGGRFLNRQGFALLADGVKVGGRAYFTRWGQREFRAIGEVSLVGATVNGELDCRGGWFRNRQGCALSVDRANIASSVDFSSDDTNVFRALGEISLVGVTIGGNLNCRGGQIHNDGRRALFAERVHIGGSAQLGDVSILGEVSFYGATIGSDLDCTHADLCNQSGSGVALRASLAQVGHDVVFGRGFQAAGEVHIHGAVISGDFDCTDGRFLNRRSVAIYASRVHVGRNAVFRRGFLAIGEVRLDGAVISADLNCENGSFVNQKRPALFGNQLKIGGSALFHALRTNGLVSLHGAEITHELVWTGVKKRPRTRLDLANATIGRLSDDKDSWPEHGHLSLDGLVYTSVSLGAPNHLSNTEARLEWLALQPPAQFSPQPYEQLAQVLRRTGHESDAKRIAIAKQDARRKYGGLGWRARLWNRVLKCTIGHGYRPHWALYWAAFFIVLGGIVFWQGYRTGIMSPTKESVYTSESYKKTRTPPASYPSFNAFVFSLDTLVPIVNLQQRDYWQPNDDSKCRLLNAEWSCGLWLRWYLRMQTLIGWLLTTLGVAGISGLVRKD